MQAFAGMLGVEGVHDFIEAPPQQMLGRVAQHLLKGSIRELKGSVTAENGNKLVCRVNQFGKLCWAGPYPRRYIHSLCHELPLRAMRCGLKPRAGLVEASVL